MKKIVVIVTLGLLLVLFLLIGRKSPEALTPVAKEDAPPTADVIRLNAREIDEPKSSPLPNEADLPATDPVEAVTSR